MPAAPLATPIESALNTSPPGLSEEWPIGRELRQVRQYARMAGQDLAPATPKQPIADS